MPYFDAYMVNRFIVVVSIEMTGNQLDQNLSKQQKYLYKIIEY